MKLLTLTLLPLLVSCAHVDANYPPQATAAPLPTTWSNSPPVLEGEGYRGFFTRWDDMEKALAWAEQVASLGSSTAARDARLLREVVKQGLSGLRVSVFFSSGKIVARSGDFLVTFSDGSTISDSWSTFWELNRASERQHNSKSGPLQVSRRFAPRGQPVEILLMVPQEHFGKMVTSIKLKGGES